MKRPLINKQPEIIVFAGPNGSGKSTFTQKLLPSDIAYINADEIKKELQCTDMEAAQKAEKQRESLLSRRESFAFETVLSTDRNLNLLQRAKKPGYFIRCYYILTSDPNINIYRVQKRVSLGGHDVPKEKIISRYNKALSLVKKLIPLCDICHIYDNSAQESFRIFKKRKELYFYDECKDWAYADIFKLTRINGMQKKNLN